jgi:hypothetical protein
MNSAVGHSGTQPFVQMFLATYKTKLRGFWQARELYRPSDRRFVGEVSANFCG